MLLGQAHLRKGEPGRPNMCWRTPGWGPRTQIAVYQARAYMDQGKYRALLEKFGTDGLPPQARLEMLLLRAGQITLECTDAAWRARSSPNK